MNDDELRALVRDAVARHVGASLPSSMAPGGPGLIRPVSGLEPPAPTIEPGVVSLGPRAFAAAHPSHYQYLALVNVGEACVIEPDVTCNHCGYCRSHGH